MAASFWRSEARSEKILRLGRRQLESLRREGHPYGDARVRSLHRLLAEGGGLPLLFPEHDVGFAYREGAVLADNMSGPATSSSGRTLSAAPEGPDGASLSSTSALRLGGRMPHFILRAWESGAGDCGESRGGCADVPTLSLSTVDLPDQIRGFLLGRFRSQVSARSAADPFRDIEGGGANGTDMTRSRAAAEASRVSLAAVLIVALPSETTTLRSDTGLDGDAAAIAPAAAETASAWWRAAALSAQREFGAERATAEQQEGRRTPCPLVVLTVCPPPRGPTSPNNRWGFAGASEASAPTKGSAEGLVRDGDVRRASSSSSLSSTGDGEERWYLGTMAPINHLERFLDGDDSVEAMSSAERRSAGAGKPSVGESGGGEPGGHHEGCGWPGLVLSMRAIDDSDGSLGEAFATSGAEAVLIRPDGHIAWVGQRRNTRDETDKEMDRARDLGRALDAVFAGRGSV